MEKKDYYEWVNIARGIGVFFVVLGHACMCIGEINQFLFQFIYSFHMPLFFFISGFCSIGLLKNNDKRDRLEFCKKRAYRLMIPYTMVGIVYIFLDSIMGIEDLYERGIFGVFIHMLQGDNPNWQLWTLYALFGCSAICALLLSSKMVLIVIVAILLQIVYCTPLVEIGYCTIVSSVEKYLIYYVSGLILRKVYIKMEHKKKNFTILYVVLLFSLLLINMLIFNVDVNRSIHLITSPLGIGLVCIWAIKLQNKGSTLKKFFDLLGNYCMEIYIVANLCQNLVEKIFFDYLAFNEWIVLLFSTFIGIVLPIVFSKFFIRKSKILSVFILGN